MSAFFELELFLILITSTPTDRNELKGETSVPNRLTLDLWISYTRKKQTGFLWITFAQNLDLEVLVTISLVLCLS